MKKCIYITIISGDQRDARPGMKGWLARREGMRMLDADGGWRVRRCESDECRVVEAKRCRSKDGRTGSTMSG